MRIGIISDVHGNYVALRTVLEHMGSIDALWCLGDIVGYGPQPNECVSTIAELPHLCIPGNHDWGMLGRLDRLSFNRDARALLEWTDNVLTPTNRQFLESLPVRLSAKLSSVTLVHASPRDPMWEYLLDIFDAAECFPLFDSRYCFVGHTHVPLVFQQVEGIVKAYIPEPGESMTFDVSPYNRDSNTEEIRMIVNPGSVGQPRDGDPRAAYMLLEIPHIPDIGEEEAKPAGITFHRVAYPIIETQQIMRGYGFPLRLVSRLELGI
ncbi:MAG: metallophosphoesterase family protein [Chloroflexia bacterium]